MPSIFFLRVNDKRIKSLFFVMGFLIGLFGTYYIVRHLYQYSGCLCLFGIHFHHLYSGIIISLFALIYIKKKKIMPHLIIGYFLLGFGLGMFIDDVLDHFIFMQDAWEFFCGICCNSANRGECIL